jgi:DNA-binding MarR family transcriptional regulator
MLKRMEKKGLIFRSVDENDKRISRVYLTSKAEGILKQIKDFTKEMENIILSGLSDSERTILMELLTKIRKHLSTYYGEKGGAEC